MSEQLIEASFREDNAPTSQRPSITTPANQRNLPDDSGSIGAVEDSSDNEADESDSHDSDDSSDDDVVLGNLKLTDKVHGFVVGDEVEVWYDEFNDWFMGTIDKCENQIVEIYFKDEDKFDTLHAKSKKIRRIK